MPTTADRKNLEGKKVAEGIETFSTPWREEGSLSNFGRQKVEGLQKGEPSLSWSMGKTNANPDDTGGQEGKTSQEVQQWENLLEVLQAAPIHNMVAKQAELLEIMEKLEGYCPEGTLQYWLLEHMHETLAQGEEDTVGVCSACLDVIANLKALKKGIKEVQCMHANITTFRTEVKTWLANQKVHIACLQETHLPEEKLQEVATSLAGMGYQTWCEAAAKTEHGTSGGLMCAAKRHLNFRYHGSMTVAGKGCQILIGRFAGRDVAVGNIYLESGTGPTSEVNSSILSWLAGQLRSLQCAWMIMGDWNVDVNEMQQLSF